MLSSTIWCDHCGLDLKPTNVRACLRRTCQTKALLPERHVQDIAAIRGRQARYPWENVDA